MGRLGAPSWGHFRPFWRPSSAKLRPKRVLEAYQHPKRDFSPNTRPRVRERHIGVQDAPQNAPRSGQDGSKRLLKSIFLALENRLNFCLVLGPILFDFGRPFGTLSTLDSRTFFALEVDLFWACYLGLILVASKTAQEGPRSLQIRPGCLQENPRSPQDVPRNPQEAPRSFQEAQALSHICLSTRAGGGGDSP